MSNCFQPRSCTSTAVDGRPSPSSPPHFYPLPPSVTSPSYRDPALPFAHLSLHSSLRSLLLRLHCSLVSFAPIQCPPIRPPFICSFIRSLHSYLAHAQISRRVANPQHLLLMACRLHPRTPQRVAGDTYSWVSGIWKVGDCRKGMLSSYL